VPQVYPQKNPENEVFPGKWTFYQIKIVVLYMIPNFQDQETRLEGSKTRPRPRPRFCVPRPRPRH